MLPYSKTRRKGRQNARSTMLWTKLLALGMIFCVGTMMVFVMWRSPGVEARLSEIDRLEETLEKKINILESEMNQIKRKMELNSKIRGENDVSSSSSSSSYPGTVRKRRNDVVASKPIPDLKPVPDLKPISISVENSKTDLTMDKVAVLVICYNRPDYLRHTLTSLFDRMPEEDVSRLPVVVSQDGNNEKVKNVVRSFESVASRKAVSFKHIQHQQTNKLGDTGYHKLARHFKWAFDKVFQEYPDVKGVIVLEDDMEIAIDFFEMFLGLLPVLENDPTLFTISAWNDNGKPQFASDSEKIYRSDFFPGLGWIMTRTLWNELGSKWPDAYWDDWLREPAQRKGRACLRPEVSRTHNFGAMGVSRGQYYDLNIKPVKLNDHFVKFRDTINQEFLKKSTYDVSFRDEVNRARLVTDISQIRNFDARLEYANMNAFKKIAKRLGIMQDEKAGVPRTAYMGVVTIKYRGYRLYITPRGGI
jgi:alpha-1,3-mannosyl-glycoprotein beta-1,2-N-acetylglucosaminyltransferase